MERKGLNMIVKSTEIVINIKNTLLISSIIYILYLYFTYILLILYYIISQIIKKIMKNKLKERTTNDEKLSKIILKSIEKESIDRVFDILTSLEQEKSSDDDSTQKQYLKNIELKANDKKMKMETMTIKPKLPNKKAPSIKQKDFTEDKNEENLKKEGEEKGNRLMKLRFGRKALRKVIRTLVEYVNKEEINLMIWENDENLDGYIDYNEFEKMYKRCIVDEKEEEPKKLYYLIQFLMYDKEKRGYIIEEDTLEILYIRYGIKFEDAISNIFR